MTKKTEPTRRQVDARREQREHGEQLVAWMRDRQAKAAKKLRSLFKARRKAAVSRGVDRVPDQIKNAPKRSVDWLIFHDQPNRATRRRQALATGRSQRPDGAGNQSHLNPARDGKGLRSGALRKELHP